jgi:hypothetical protein
MNGNHFEPSKPESRDIKNYSKQTYFRAEPKAKKKGEENVD